MKLIIADDHDLVRHAITSLIERDDPGSVILQAGDLYSAQQFAAEHQDIELVLLDVHMPGMNKMTGVRELLAQYPQLIVVLMSGYIGQGDIERGFKMGARGFIPKTMNGKTLVSVLHLVRTGARYVPDLVLGTETPQRRHTDSTLSNRETDVLLQLVKGASNKVIARNLSIEETTVKLHLRSLFKKLKVSNRTEAVIAAMDSGIVASY